MCRSRKLNNQINTIHERDLHIVFQDKHTSFDELLKKAGTVKIQDRNLQIFATEMYNIFRGKQLYV